MLMNRISAVHHHLLGPCVRSGDTVADCTAGNGRDALFLAGKVGVGGHLFAFDVQPEALARTRKRLLAGGVEKERFTLVLDSHEHVHRHVPAGIAAAVYNLGYLPGSDRRIVTRGDSTVRSLGRTLGLLRAGGVISLTLYYGHPGAAEEAEAVLRYAGSLDAAGFTVLHLGYHNQPKDPPSLLMVQRLR